jgi:hypothetical protein
VHGEATLEVAGEVVSLEGSTAQRRPSTLLSPWMAALTGREGAANRVGAVEDFRRGLLQKY